MQFSFDEKDQRRKSGMKMKSPEMGQEITAGLRAISWFILWRSANKADSVQPTKSDEKRV